ncbi:MAG: fumarylacetoacetate hydrolase family protein, partial [Rhodobacteraceae bacterium]|nr:fumarylacetoacetate hydrolase family protein [Paracoccaceae bacterium]
MKLATLKDGTRDGSLVVVSQDLTRCRATGDLAPTLQDALDRWKEVAPRLREMAADLEAGSAPSNPFDQTSCHSPLPRAYQWADGSAYLNHVELVRKARNAQVPDSFYSDPLMYQGGSDSFLGPRDPIVIADPAWGCDMEAEVAVITDDVPMG